MMLLNGVMLKGLSKLQTIQVLKGGKFVSDSLWGYRGVSILHTHVMFPNPTIEIPIL